MTENSVHTGHSSLPDRLLDTNGHSSHSGRRALIITDKTCEERRRYTKDKHYKETDT